MAGHVPAISIPIAKPCHHKRDGRDKPGHDERDGIHYIADTGIRRRRIDGDLQ
jgi:hypothetical protein